MFFKCKMNEGRYGRLYEYIIVEGVDSDEAYDRAQDMPMIFGDATLAQDDLDPVEVANPLSQPWPVFTSAYYERDLAEAVKELTPNS